MTILNQPYSCVGSISKFILDDVGSVVEFVAEMYGVISTGSICSGFLVFHLELVEVQTGEDG
jgi:hypothetical protein